MRDARALLGTETQAEVARLREDNQTLDERITKLQVENEQLRRRRKTTSSIAFPDADQRQRCVEKELAAMREVSVFLRFVRTRTAKASLPPQKITITLKI